MSLSAVRVAQSGIGAGFFCDGSLSVLFAVLLKFLRGRGEKAWFCRGELMVRTWWFVWWTWSFGRALKNAEKCAMDFDFIFSVFQSGF